jgi:hypothetical protein
MTLNNATFSLNAFEKRAKSVQMLLKSVQTPFENNLKSIQKVGAFRKLARRNTYRDFGDRLGVGCMGFIEGSVLDDYDCDIIMEFIIRSLNFSRFKRWFCPTYKFSYHMVHTLRFACLRHFNDEFHWTDSCSFFQGRMSVRAGGKHPFGGLHSNNIQHSTFG